MSRKKKLRNEKVSVKGIFKDNSLPWLFAVTLFLSAMLLFLVEPMMAKMILPLLGGTTAVWNTCMVFFQATLLAGYAYAHASSALLRVRHQLLLHMALLFIPVIALPLGVTEDWVPPAEDSPIVWLLLLLLVSVSPPFFVLSASAPLLQKWFANTSHPAAKDPYFLYAASNLGSLLALNGYLAVIEPLLPLKKEHWLSQSWLWTAGYGLLVLLVLRCASVVARTLEAEGTPERGNQAKPAPEKSHGDPALVRPSVLDRLRWVALAFVPSSLMLGVTTYITLDIAAVALLWVVPLELYLLSFVLVFAKWPLWLHNGLILVLPPVLLFLIFEMRTVLIAWIAPIIIMHLLVFFMVALVCHGELARKRPATRYLTEFYLWISVGGVLGGLFNALLAPVIFSSVVEYTLALFFACLLLPGRGTQQKPWLSRWLPGRLAKPASVLVDAAIAVAVGLITFELIGFFVVRDIAIAWLADLRAALRDRLFVYLGDVMGLRSAWLVAIVIYGLPLLLAYVWVARPFQLMRWAIAALFRRSLSPREPLRNYFYVVRPLGLGLAVGAYLVVASSWDELTRGEPVVYQQRNFYGVLQVNVSSEYGISFLKLVNGTTSHGVQRNCWDKETVAPLFAPVAVYASPDVCFCTAFRYLAWRELAREPLSYYHRTGPIGQVFAAFSGPHAKKEIAMIGLGAGTLASYGEPGQTLTFFDIDPAVVDVAGRYFSYLYDCRADWKIVLGDARLRMRLAEDKQFQLIIVDAFNSDAIPIHLLTREALELYFKKLSADGIVALHISNRYLDLEPVLGNLANDLHLVGLAQFDYELSAKPGKRSSNWVLLANRMEDFGRLPAVVDVPGRPRWHPIVNRPEVGVWTDDYSNLISVFKWK